MIELKKRSFREFVIKLQSHPQRLKKRIYFSKTSEEIRGEGGGLQRKNVGGEWQVKKGKVVSCIPKVVRTMISCDEFAILLDSATKLRHK